MSFAAEVLAVLTGQTCGDSCWHAREAICRCSCGGANHGCLKVEGKDQPIRTSKINGRMRQLHAVGEYPDLMKQAEEMNRANGPYRIDPVTYHDGTKGEYKYWYHETDPGAPAFLKCASKDQIARWPELAAWINILPYQMKPYMIWKLV